MAKSVRASSNGRPWRGIEVMVANIAEAELEVDGLQTHTLAVNIGRPYRLEGRVDGATANAVMQHGMLKIVPAGPRSRWSWNNGAPLDILHLSIAAEDFKAHAKEIEIPGEPLIATRVGVADASLLLLGRALVEELRAPHAHALVADALHIDVITQMMRNYSSAQLTPELRRTPGRLDTRTLRAIDEHIDQYLGENLGVEELAAIAGISRFHFLRRFRATVGSTPYQYVMKRRIERASLLLRSTLQSTSEIAIATGFADQSHLTRQIRRRYGVPPGTLRKGSTIIQEIDSDVA